MWWSPTCDRVDSFACSSNFSRFTYLRFSIVLNPSIQLGDHEWPFWKSERGLCILSQEPQKGFFLLLLANPHSALRQYIYYDDSTRCTPCEKRDLTCNLFISVETMAITRQGTPTSITTVSSSEPWDKSPPTSAVYSNVSYTHPSQEIYYQPTTIYHPDSEGIIVQTP